MRRLFAAGLLVVASLTVAACGNDDDIDDVDVPTESSTDLTTLGTPDLSLATTVPSSEMSEATTVDNSALDPIGTVSDDSPGTTP